MEIETQENRTLTGSYAKLVNDKPRAADALARIEGAFAHRIAGGHWNAKQADFWADLVLDWPEAMTVAVCEQVIGQYDNIPSAAEMLRMKREYLAAQNTPAGQPTSFEKLAAKHGPPWWFALTAKLQRKGFKMTEIGDELVAEAKRRNETLPSGLYLGGGRTS